MAKVVQDCRGNSKYNDDSYIGMKSGKLTVTNIVYENGLKFVVDCECGTRDKRVRPDRVVKGTAYSCGCLHFVGERIIKELFDEYGVYYIPQYSFDDLRGVNGGKLKFDYAICDSKGTVLSLLEYTSTKHFSISGNSLTRLGNLTSSQEHDLRKTNYCIEHGIKLYRIEITTDKKDIFNKLVEYGIINKKYERDLRRNSIMAVSLSKGGKVSLTKDNPNLDNIIVGLGWDVAQQYAGAKDFDLDAVAFMVGADGKTAENDFIYWNNLKSTGIEHTGDNRTGAGDGDDETIKISLKQIPQHIQRIAIAVSIFEATSRGQNFGQVSNAYIHIQDATTGKELVRYDLSEDYDVQMSLVVGELYRHNGEWKFKAIGEGYANELAGVCAQFGLDAQ